MPKLSAACADYKAREHFRRLACLHGPVHDDPECLIRQGRCKRPARHAGKVARAIARDAEQAANGVLICRVPGLD
jgi:hypothetical protein